MRVAVFTLVPLLATFVYAQAQQSTRTETHTSSSRTTYNGTLVDAGCRSTQVIESHTTTIGVSRHTDVTRTNTAECPVTSATTSYGLLTPDGRYVRFDQTSNTRINEVVKNNKSWSKDLQDKKPINIQVSGSQNGDLFVVDSVH